MKKIVFLLLSILLCFCVAACSSNQPVITETSTSNETVSKTMTETVSQTASQTVINEETAAPDKTTSQSSTVKSPDVSSEISKTETSKTQTSRNTAVKNNAVSTNRTTAKTTSKKTVTTKQTAKNTETTKPDTSKASTAVKTTKFSQTTCFVTVECKSVLNNMDNLKSGHEQYVPSDGYIINSLQVTVKNGSSAYDAVKSACDKSGVKLTAIDSIYGGKYIVGFNNIDEKDCGSGSGWIYKVNGNMPAYTCSNYSVSSGDNIIFSYVV